MAERRKSIPDQINAAANAIGERADHPWRQIKEAVGVDEAERWSVEQVQFSEDARMAARRALWFLRLAEIDSDPVLLEHARENAVAQLDAVKVPRPEHWCHQGDPADKCQYSGAIEPTFAKLVEGWNANVQALGGGPHLLVQGLDALGQLGHRVGGALGGQRGRVAVADHDGRWAQAVAPPGSGQVGGERDAARRDALVQRQAFAATASTQQPQRR